MVEGAVQGSPNIQPCWLPSSVSRPAGSTGKPVRHSLSASIGLYTEEPKVEQMPGCLLAVIAVLHT